MASENETVEEVAAHYRAVWQGCEDECDKCKIAKRLRTGKPRPCRNCYRFATWRDAFRQWRHIASVKMMNRNQTFQFLEWLFASCEEGGAK